MLPEEEGPITAVEGKLRARIRPFADGVVRDGEWAVFQAELANGRASEAVQLELTEGLGEDAAAVHFGRVVDLPKGSRKVVDVYYVVGRSGGLRKVLVSPENGGGGVVQAPVRMADASDVTVAVIGDDPLGVQAVPDTWGGSVPGTRPRFAEDGSRRVWVGLAPLNTLPERSVGWSAFDWVIWPEAQPSRVSPEAMTALRHWVADGGNLFVTVSDRWAEVRGTPLEALLPVRVTGSEVADLGPLLRRLGDTATGPRPAAPVARAVLDDGAWTLIPDVDGNPLWAIGPYGLGSVSVLLANPAVSPLADALPRDALWRKLLFLPAPGLEAGATLYQPFAGLPSAPDGADLAYLLRALAPPPTSGAGIDPMGTPGSRYPTFETDLRVPLSDVPGVAPLPLPILLGLSLLYLLAIGPIDWFVLRALKRQPWTWVTFPLIVIAFSAFALIGTRYYKGNQAVVRRLEVVDVLPGTGLWRGQTFVGLFSTRRGVVELRSGEQDGMVQPLSRMGFMDAPAVVAAEGAGALSWSAETWTLAYARTGWVGERAGEVRVLSSGDDFVELESTLPFVLSPAELHLGSRIYPIEQLAPGRLRVVLERGGAPGLDVEQHPGLSLLLRGPDPGRGHFFSHGAMTVLGRAIEPIDRLQITGVAPESSHETLVRVRLVPAPAVGRAGWPSHSMLSTTMFEESR